jgi:hypothetical protein
MGIPPIGVATVQIIVFIAIFTESLARPKILRGNTYKGYAESLRSESAESDAAGLHYHQMATRQATTFPGVAGQCFWCFWRFR